MNHRATVRVKPQRGVFGAERATSLSQGALREHQRRARLRERREWSLPGPLPALTQPGSPLHPTRSLIGYAAWRAPLRRLRVAASHAPVTIKLLRRQVGQERLVASTCLGLVRVELLQ